MKLIFNIHKDKPFKNSKDLRKLFCTRYNLSCKNANELVLEIINYQIFKYGIQLYRNERL